MKRISEHLKRVRHSRSGFTLLETMVSMLIVALASMAMVTGVQLAVDSYRRTIDAANGRVLLTTAMTTLRNELSTSKDVDVSGNVLTFRNTKTGMAMKVYLAPNDDASTDTADHAAMTRGVSSGYLVDPVTATSTLQLTYTSVSVEDGVVKFEDLRVYKPNADGTEGKIITSVDAYSVRLP